VASVSLKAFVRSSRFLAYASWRVSRAFLGRTLISKPKRSATWENFRIPNSSIVPAFDP